MTGKTAASTGATLTDAEFFAPLIDSWRPRRDQSAYEAYAASDLMTANGSVETGTDNSLTLTFSMAHRMALAVVELPAFGYRFTNKPSIPDYVISGPTEFVSEALPYLISDGICRYLSILLQAWNFPPTMTGCNVNFRLKSSPIKFPAAVTGYTRSMAEGS